MDEQDYKKIEERIRKIFPWKDDRREKLCKHLLRVCKGFIVSGLNDLNFFTEITSDSITKFWQRTSEALIADCLIDNKFEFGMRKKLDESPDYLVMDGNRKVWIELICPEPIDVLKDYINQKSGAIWMPHEAILLRWTSAIKEKAEKLF